MKKIFMIGFAIFSMIAFSMNVNATDINNTTDMSSVITGSTIDGNKITLTQNVDLGSNYLNIISGTHIIDLNGYTLSGNNSVVVYINGENANLTINDTSATKKGKVVCTNEDEYTSLAAVDLMAGTLVINGGNFESNDLGVYIEDKATINDGVFKGTYGAVVSSGSDLTINDGTFLGEDGLYVDSGSDVTINDGTFGNINSIEGIFIEGATVTIKDATVNGGAENGVGITVISFGSTISLTIDNINVTGTSAGLYVDAMEENDNNLVKVNGGIFSGKEVGFVVGEKMAAYTKISGGKYKSTNTDENNNYGGVAIMFVVDNEDLNSPTYVAPYTLNDLLETGYNYSNRVFNNKNMIRYHGAVVSVTAKMFGTAKDVFVAIEKTITVKNDIVNGTVTVQDKAVKGEEVKLTVTPAAGYKLKSISAKDKFDEMPVTITNNKLIMPDYNLFIGAEFEVDYSYFNESKGQTYVINKNDNLVFKLKPNYNLFENGGKVYVDGVLVDQKYITSRSGSTIITLSKDYLNTLTPKKHNLRVTFNTNESVETTFTVVKENLNKSDKTNTIVPKETNPKTGDTIMTSVLLGSISLIGLLGTEYYIKKKRYN